MTTKDQALKQRAAELIKAFKDAPTPHVSGGMESKPAPDCRTCKNYRHSFNFEACGSPIQICTNGDQYKPAPTIILWKSI